MVILHITKPTDNAKFESRKPVTFHGTAPTGIVSVSLRADDQYDLGSNHVDSSGSWSITYSGFTNTGDRKITAIGFDKANQKKGETSIHINIAKLSSVNDYTTTIYDGLGLDAYKTLDHAIKTPVDWELTDAEGRKLFEKGILPILQSKDSFMQATAKGEQILAQLVAQNQDNYGIHHAPCAYSVSCVMKYIAEILGFATVKNLFQDPCLIDNVQVTGVEKKLRRLGFNYFLKKDYFAPHGAIGVIWPRNGQDISDHIYFITKDGEKRTEFPNPENSWDDGQGQHEKGINGEKWQIKDLHAENLDFFDHVYMQWTNGYTEGFWLLPGIYPLKR